MRLARESRSVIDADSPAKDAKLPWEDEVRAAIEKLRAKKEAEKGKAD